MDRFFIRPATEGAVITDPETGDVIEAEGRDLPRNTYWLALVLRGDMIEVPKPADPAGKSTRRAADAVAATTQE